MKTPGTTHPLSAANSADFPFCEEPWTNPIKMGRYLLLLCTILPALPLAQDTLNVQCAGTLSSSEVSSVDGLTSTPTA